MGFELELVENTDLARLAWLARIDRQAKRVTVTHGRDVERGDSWLVEGVWPGPFSDLGFAGTEHFFGSGLKLTERGVRLVPSCASVDRLLLAELEEIVYASNSLPLLLAATGARLDLSLIHISEPTRR